MTAKSATSTDILETSAGEVHFFPLGHASVRLTFAGMEIYIDPFTRIADFSRMPKADWILITHEHHDHFDPEAIRALKTVKTGVILTDKCAPEMAEGIVMRNGDSRDMGAWTIEAIPAYNLVHKRENGQPYHPRGEGNGYILSLGGKRVYFAGDTEDTPEMKALREIDCAFLPMNLPYTMTPEMVAGAAKVFRPRILYPYHFGDTDLSKLEDLLRGEKGIELRLRKMA
jgi:L-ascorbate metabolism protein UlaG (beta-lactamase superfamily)